MRPLEPVMMTLVIMVCVATESQSPRRKLNPFLHVPALPWQKVYSKTSHRFSVVRNTSQFLGFIGTNGRRYSSLIIFIIASAAFTGVGLVSMNRSLNSA